MHFNNVLVQGRHVCVHEILLFVDDLIDVKGKLVSVTSQVRQLRCVKRSGCFEWVDSALVRALQSGHWLVIDNVNFCR